MDMDSANKAFEERLNTTAEELMELLNDYVNNFAYAKQADLFIEKLKKQHRMTQANVIRMLICSLVRYADLDESEIDGRNRAAIRQARTIKHFLNEAKGYRYIWI